MKEPKLNDLRDEPSPYQNREARNQKQHNWDVLRRFGESVGGFLTNSVGEINNAVSDASDRMDGIEDRYNNQIAGNTDLKEIIDAREGHVTLNERLNEATQIKDSSGFIVKNLFEAALVTLNSKIDKNKFNVGYITDTHWEPAPVVYGQSDLSLSHLANLMELEPKLDTIIAGGDNTNSYSKSLAYVKKFVSIFGTNLLNTGTAADKFALIGNHDDGSLRGEKLKRDVKPDDIVKIKDFADAYHFNGQFDEVRDANSPWFYKDYPEAKIRVIGINTQDIDEDSVNDFGALKYTRQRTFGIRQSQFDFLINKALVVPEGYAIMIFGHAPLKPDGDYGDDGVWINNQLLINVLNAFKLGSKFVGAGSTEDFEVNLSVDFNNQGERSIIGYFCGHIHKEYLNLASELKYGANFNMITCLASLNQVAEDTGTVNEDGLTIIAVDSKNKQCELLGFGRSTNREFNY